MATYPRPRSTRLLLITLLVTSLVTITVDFRSGERGPLAAIGRAGISIVAPLQEGVSAITRPVGNFFSTLFRAGSLAEENAALKEQLEGFTTSIPQSVALERENEFFRQALDLEAREGFDLMGATVTADSVSNFEWAVWINRGSSDGVYPDQPVVTGAGVVGRVVKVAPSTAKVLLIIDPSSRIAVALASTGERGVLVGQRDDDLRLDLIEAGTEVQPGERVDTASYGAGSLFPPGISVGAVSLVESTETGDSMLILVRPVVDFSRLEYVFLVKEREPAAGDRRPSV
ncbi:MAG: rod shape-determining protein MreC [Actinomycetota bacterium]